MYHAKCPSELSDKINIAESGKRVAERVKYRNGRDYKLHILKYLL